MADETHAEEKNERSRQHAMLMYCSYKGDTIYWNDWRRDNPDNAPWLLGIDLSEADLARADLRRADLREADLTKANLRRACLIGADARKAKFIEANMEKAELQNSDCRETNFREANLQVGAVNMALFNGANFRQANLSIANLCCSHFQGANFYRANLEYSTIENAILNEADLSSAKLNWSDSSWSNFIGADLSHAKLIGADLSGSKLSGADLSYAEIKGVVFNNSDLNLIDFKKLNLSGAIVDQRTIKKSKKYPNIVQGINGIYNENNNTAALMAMIPPGDSMQGPNPNAVIESLKRARRLHGISMSLVGITLLFALTNPKGVVSFPYSKEFKLSIEVFGLLSMLMSIGLLTLVTSFLKDGLTGTMYLQDRQSASTVGNFPWILSRYAKSKSDRYQTDVSRAMKIGSTIFPHRTKLTKIKNRINLPRISVIESLTARFIMSFHSLLYLLFFDNWSYHSWKFLNINIKSIYFLAIPLILLSIRTFYLSQKFQRPIIFDLKNEVEFEKTEEELRKKPIEIVEAIKKQTEAVKDLSNILKTINNEKSKNNVEEKPE